MEPVCQLRSRAVIESFLRRDTAMHVYALADLDDGLWPLTTWYGLGPEDAPEALCLVFEGLSTPILYAVAPEGDEPTRRLLEQLAGSLPAPIEVSLSPGHETVLEGALRFVEVREQIKMVLEADAPTPAPGKGSCERLDAERFEELRDFYAERAYAPGEEGGRFFERAMLDAGPYFGVRQEGLLVAAGGVHVVSEQYGVAAVGNVATAPAARGRGLATRVAAAVCTELRQRVPVVGLNVGAESAAARRLYEGLGFRPVCRYLEISCERSAL